MTTRRKFIQRTGAMAGATLLQGFASSALANQVQPGSAEEIRSQLLVPEGRVYLNTGSLGPSPKVVLQSVIDAMWTLEKDPVSENWGRLGVQMEAVRQKVAEFIHANAAEILLTRNTTEGLSLVCQVLPLQKDDEIITTTLEHGGGEVGLEYLERTRGAKIVKIELGLPPENPEEIVAAVERAITPRTKLVMLSHVNTITGVLMPMNEISRITSAHGIYLLCDGAQAPGLTPIDVKAMGVDAYSSSGHKWLLGPKETGFLYVRRGFPGSLPPVFTQSGFDSYSKSSGTRNVATWIGLGTALDWHQALGPALASGYCLDLRNYCLSELKKMKGLRIISPENRLLSTGIVSFELTDKKNVDIYSRLKEKDIVVKVLPQLNAIRISCHVFVSRSDIDRFLAELQHLL